MERNQPFWENSVIQVALRLRFLKVSSIKLSKYKVKSVFVFSMLMIYSLTAIGVTVHFHYCMDRFAGWSLIDNQDKPCSKCGMHSHKKGCCHDQHKQIKLSDDHQKTAFSIKSFPKSQDYSSPIAYVESPSVQWKNHTNQLVPLPPLLNETRLHLQYRVFLI